MNSPTPPFRVVAVISDQEPWVFTPRREADVLDLAAELRREWEHDERFVGLLITDAAGVRWTAGAALRPVVEAA